MTDDLLAQLHKLPAFTGFALGDIRVIPLQTLDHSEVYRVRLRDGNSLILKRAGVSAGAELAARERRFYEFVAPRLPEGLVPKPVFTTDDPAGWLAIEDLADTHRPAADSSAPSYEECTQLVQALARLHATSLLDEPVSGAWTEAKRSLPDGGIPQRTALFLAALPSFANLIEGRVNPREWQFLADLSSISEHLSKVSAAEMSTLVHGDAHFSNFMYSADAGACIIDWALPMMGFGEIDLAHALALNLPRHLALEWENDLLNVYVEQLASLDCPVDRDSVEQRYGVAVLYGFVSPVLWWSSGVPENYWWPAFSNLLEAARDRGLLA